MDPTHQNYLLVLNQGQRNQEDRDVGYHSPLVAIQVKPKTSEYILHIYVVLFNACALSVKLSGTKIQVEPKKRGQLVHVECRAYYRGVRHDKKDKLGLVQFEVQIL